MGAVNDIRLVIGTKLDVSEDPSFEITDDDPDVQAYAIYTYCSWLLERDRARRSTRENPRSNGAGNC